MDCFWTVRRGIDVQAVWWSRTTKSSSPLFQSSTCTPSRLVLVIPSSTSAQSTRSPTALTSTISRSCWCARRRVRITGPCVVSPLCVTLSRRCHVVQQNGCIVTSGTARWGLLTRPGAVRCCTKCNKCHNCIFCGIFASLAKAAIHISLWLTERVQLFVYCTIFLELQFVDLTVFHIYFAVIYLFIHCSH